MTVLHRSDLVGQDLFMEPEHDEREYPRQDPMQVMDTLLGLKGLHVIGLVSKPGAVRAVVEPAGDEGDGVHDGKALRGLGGRLAE